jgi:nicotinamidase-related amidase
MNKTLVLVMDYQRKQLNSFSNEFQNEIIARANLVLDKARSKGLPVIHVEVQRGERTPETEIHPAMTPKIGEVLLTKRRTGPFSTTNIDEILKKQGIETIVMMGIRTSGCVLTAVRWAADLDYKLIVLSDCCADAEEDVQYILMEKVFPRQATVVTAQEFVQSLEKS